jgi:hypothetical protein
MITLYPFHTQLANAWKLFLSRWGSAVVLQLLILLPAVFMYPLVIKYVRALEAGVNSSSVFVISPEVTLFLVGFVLLVLVGAFIAAATGILFAVKQKISLGKVMTSTLVTYIPVVYTSVLSGLAVLITLIPALLLNYWYGIFALGGAPVTEGGLLAVEAIVLIAIVALLIPAIIVATWVMYAPLGVALKATPAGFTAIMHAKHLVRHHVWQLVWRMVGSMVLFQVVSASVSTLPYASYIVPFVLSIIIMAFFVEMYKELQEG